jgi:hypothetical protein
MVSYEILKLAKDDCGQDTDFRLKITPGSGYAFGSFSVDTVVNGYATEVTVVLTNSGSGSTVVQHLCTAPVVCSPNSVLLTITTKVSGEPDKEDEIDYDNAKDG